MRTLMLLTMMKAKLHRATVTQADLEYEGSISVDLDLLDAAGILQNEQVDVLNINNGDGTGVCLSLEISRTGETGAVT